MKLHPALLFGGLGGTRSKNKFLMPVSHHVLAVDQSYTQQHWVLIWHVQIDHKSTHVIRTSPSDGPSDCGERSCHIIFKTYGGIIRSVKFIFIYKASVGNQNDLAALQKPWASTLDNQQRQKNLSFNRQKSGADQAHLGGTGLLLMASWGKKENGGRTENRHIDHTCNYMYRICQKMPQVKSEKSFQ